MPAVAQYNNRGQTELSSIPNFAEALGRLLNPYETSYLRVPFYLTSSYRKQLSVPGVSMLINPNNVSFRTAKRITRRDTQGGAVFTHWTNRMGRNNDILEVDFNGQTGNMNMNRGAYRKGSWTNEASSRINRGVDWINQKMAETLNKRQDNGLQLTTNLNMAGTSKLIAFQNLYSLTREPVVDPRTKEPIYYYIMYSSPVFGNTTVTLIGHFNRVLDFTDSAEPSPFSAQYSFGFTAVFLLRKK